jgi:hypothetical protein
MNYRKHQWPDLNIQQPPVRPTETIDIGARLDLLFCKMDRLERQMIELAKLIKEK